MDACRRISRARRQDASTCWFSTIVAILAYSDRARLVARAALAHAAGWPRGGLRGLALRALALVVRRARDGDADLLEAVFAVFGDRDLLHLMHASDPRDMTFDPYAKCGYDPLHYFERVAGFAGFRAAVLELEHDAETDGASVVVRDASEWASWGNEKAPVARFDECDVLLVRWIPGARGRSPARAGPLPPATLTFRDAGAVTVRSASGGRDFLLDAALLRNDTHSVAGVTCDKVRKVYSGWRAASGAAGDAGACGPMDWDWARRLDEFALSRRACKLVAPRSEDDASAPLSAAVHPRHGRVWVYVAEGRGRKRRREPAAAPSRSVDRAADLAYQVAALVLAAPRGAGGPAAALRRSAARSKDLADASPSTHVSAKFFAAHLGAARQSTAGLLASVVTPDALVALVLRDYPTHRWLSADAPSLAGARAGDAVAQLLWALTNADVAQVSLDDVVLGAGARLDLAEHDDPAVVVVEAPTPGDALPDVRWAPARLAAAGGAPEFRLHACAGWERAGLTVGRVLEAEPKPAGASPRRVVVPFESPWRDVPGVALPARRGEVPARASAWIYLVDR